jgi:hypothetical protein
VSRHHGDAVMLVVSLRRSGLLRPAAGRLQHKSPKGAGLRDLTQADCDQVALKLNTRPRQKLGWNTPNRPSTRPPVQQPCGTDLPPYWPNCPNDALRSNPG